MLQRERAKFLNYIAIRRIMLSFLYKSNVYFGPLSLEKLQATSYWL